MRWKVRPGEWRDAPGLARLIDAFAQGHPSASIERSPDRIAPYFFGDKRVGNLLVADRAGELIGFTTWRKDFDPFWCFECGEVTSVFVLPGHRGVGVAATLIAAAFAGIRDAGGKYAYGYPSEEPGPFFQRVAISYPSRWCHVSERAFHRLADLAGADPREIARKLPDPTWNKL
jgi:GNAT superfamily N-acetyltransferase